VRYTQKSPTSAKEPHVENTFCVYSLPYRASKRCAQRFQYLQKSPRCTQKSPVHAKKPYIESTLSVHSLHINRVWISAKEPYISEKNPSSPHNSPIYLQKGPIHVQNTLGVHLLRTVSNLAKLCTNSPIYAQEPCKCKEPYKKKNSWRASLRTVSSLEKGCTMSTI